MILLIGNYPHDGQESMQRFAAAMEQGLQDRGMAVEVLVPQPFFGRLKKSGHGLGKWLGYIDKFLLFPIHLRRRISEIHSIRPDHPSSIPDSLPPLVVHICDHSNAFYTRYLHGVPDVVTCHDVLALRSARGDFRENATSWTGRQLQSLILRGLQRARQIACDSLPTQEQLLEISGVPRERTTFVEIGLNYPYAPLPPSEARVLVDAVLLGRGLGKWSGRPYVMHIGGNQWYKNREGVMRIYLQLRRQRESAPVLFMIGPPLPEDLRALIDAEAPTSICEIGKLSNEELRAFYSVAEALIFPSKYEGFGWPIIEAQACGCRVATSDAAPMNQIGGPAAAYFDPENLTAAAAVVAALLAEPPEARGARVTASLENAARFSPDAMIGRYLDLYRTLA